MNVRIAIRLFGLGLVLAAGTTRGPAQSCTMPSASLVGWWAAEGTGSDEMGGSPAGLGNGLSFTAGKVGQAFSFDGVDDYLAVGASPSLDVGSGDGFTIEGWIRPANTSSHSTIAEWNDGAGGVGVHFVHSIGALGGAGSLFANIQDIGGGSHYFATSPGLLNTANFQHVALTYSKASGQAKIYYNGSPMVALDVGPVTPQTSYPLYFGYRASGNGVGSLFQGEMDEMSLYNQALSDAEILAIYNAASSGKCKSGPPTILTQPVSRTVAAGASPRFLVTATGLHLNYQWQFNNAPLSNATNATLQLNQVQLLQAGNYSVIVSNEFGSVPSSNAILTVLDLCISPANGLMSWWPADGSATDLFSGNNLTLSGGLNYSSGKIGQAFYFDGIDDYATLPAGSADVGSGEGFSLEGWLKPENVNAPHALAEWNSGSTLGVHLWMSVTGYGGAGSLFANVEGTNGTAHLLVSPAGILTSNYQHIALTYNRTSGLAKLFRNGNVVASQNFGSFRPQTTYPFYLGKRISSGGPAF